jgi:hypothetical protein
VSERVAAAFDELRDAVLEALKSLEGGGGSTPPPPPPPVSTGIDLSRWKLTLPVVKDGKVVEIWPPKLATHTDQFWTKLPSGSYRCRVWHGSGTTKNSSNPRTELRGLNAQGTNELDWSAADEDTSLTVVTQVNRLTKVKPHVVLLQIHGGDDDLTVFRLEGTKLWITHGDDTHAHLVTDDFRLGVPHELKMHVRDGLVNYWYDRQPVDFTLEADDDACYWKVGNYLQSNPKTAPTESIDEYCEVVLHSVVVT